MEKKQISTVEEVHCEREKYNQEYHELCERLAQEQDEKEKNRLQGLIELNRYNERALMFKELRIKLLNVKDNKERNEVIDAFVEETKGDRERAKEATKRIKMEMAENCRRQLEERRRIAAERKILAEEKRKQIAEKKRLAEEKRNLIAEQKRLAAEKRKKIAESKRLAAEEKKRLAEERKIRAEQKKKPTEEKTNKNKKVDN